MAFSDEGKRWRARAMSKPSGCESTDFTEYPSICWFALGIRRWRWRISHFLLHGSKETASILAHIIRKITTYSTDARQSATRPFRDLNVGDSEPSLSQIVTVFAMLGGTSFFVDRHGVSSKYINCVFRVILEADRRLATLLSLDVIVKCG